MIRVLLIDNLFDPDFGLGVEMGPFEADANPPHPALEQRSNRIKDLIPARRAIQPDHVAVQQQPAKTRLRWSVPYRSRSCPAETSKPTRGPLFSASTLEVIVVDHRIRADLLERHVQPGVTQSCRALQQTIEQADRQVVRCRIDLAATSLLPSTKMPSVRVPQRQCRLSAREFIVHVEMHLVNDHRTYRLYYRGRAAWVAG